MVYIFQKNPVFAAKWFRQIWTNKILFRAQGHFTSISFCRLLLQECYLHGNSKCLAPRIANDCSSTCKRGKCRILGQKGFDLTTPLCCTRHHSALSYSGQCKSGRICMLHLCIFTFYLEYVWFYALHMPGFAALRDGRGRGSN